MKTYDIIIIGAGVTGMASAMYAGRLNLKTLVIGTNSANELPIGGVITLTEVVENYPGFIRLTGPELAEKIRLHALDYKPLVEIKEDLVMDIKKYGDCFTVSTNSGKSYISKTILFATGTKWRKLPMKGALEYESKGVHYCALCLPKDESIIVNSSIKKIKDITPLTRVLTLNGTYKEIGGFIKRTYKGNLIKIKPRFFSEPVLLTPNHPVYTMNYYRKNKYLGNYKWNYNVEFTKPTWKEAGKLKEGDCVLYPIIKETKDIKYIKISDFIEVKKLKNSYVTPLYPTKTSNKIKDKISINKDFLRLVGYYLAEGSAHKHQLRFYFNKNEKDYINDVKDLLKKIFNLKVDLRIVNNVCYMGVYSKVLSDLFKLLFGNYSFNKNLPHWIMTLPKDKQKEVIKGMWRGDGCLREKDFTYVTSSRNLAYQLRDLLLRQGIICGLQKRDKRGLNRWQNRIEGRVVGFDHDKYHVVVGGQFLEIISNLLEIKHPELSKRKYINKQAWLKNGFAILPIRKIEKEYYEGEVLNLGVQENNTYIAKNFIVHNCDGALFRNKIVAVVGGSDSAAKEALLLSEYAKKVYIIYRGEEIRPEPINGERIKRNKKITVITKTNVTEIRGDKFVTHIVLDNKFQGSNILKLDGVFGAIGSDPLSELAKKLGVKINEKSEIIIDHHNSKTNIPGIFAAGDVVDTEFKQAITGVAEGVTATYHAYKYINENTLICTMQDEDVKKKK